MISVVQALKDIVHIPDVGSGMIYIWSRNFLSFKRSFISSVFWMLFEPLVYFLAIGYGVGHYIGEIYGQPYILFYLPALISTSVMLISFYEGTYGCFNKLRYQKTFEVSLRAPISVSELALGEIAWAASKGFLSALLISLVAINFDLMSWDNWFAFIFIQLLLSWTFAALGLLFTTFADGFEFFTYVQIGLIVPMGLCSATYFPLDRFPDWLRPIAYLSPLTHGVSAGRTVLAGQANSFLFLNIAVLFSLSVLVTNWASARLRRDMLV